MLADRQTDWQIKVESDERWEDTEKETDRETDGTAEEIGTASENNSRRYTKATELVSENDTSVHVSFSCVFPKLYFLFKRAMNL